MQRPRKRRAPSLRVLCASRPLPPLRSSYCTFAVTDAAPFSVKVQLFDLLFVHAPEKIASRPSPTVSVIDVPAVNDADAVVPVTTFRPDGVLVT